MLHPNQFEVNEAWIAFQLNDQPIRDARLKKLVAELSLRKLLLPVDT